MASGEIVERIVQDLPLVVVEGKVVEGVWEIGQRRQKPASKMTEAWLRAHDGTLFPIKLVFSSGAIAGHELAVVGLPGRRQPLRTLAVVDKTTRRTDVFTHGWEPLAYSSGRLLVAVMGVVLFLAGAWAVNISGDSVITVNNVFAATSLIAGALISAAFAAARARMVRAVRCLAASALPHDQGELHTHQEN